MQHLFSMHASAHSNNYWQAYVLLLLGFVFLTLAWLGMFNAFSIGCCSLVLGCWELHRSTPGAFSQQVV